MQEQYARTTMLIGEEGVASLRAARVAIFGVGGVGSFAVEALARAGVGHLMLVDDDVVSLSNLNRQLIALHSTIGQPKALLAKERILDIDPDTSVDARVVRYEADTADSFDFSAYDYIVDAIDSVTSKILLIERAKIAGVPIISCMGTGNKLDPTAIRVDDIENTQVCPLARVMRRELKKRGIKGVRVVWSMEEPLAPRTEAKDAQPGRRAIPSSISYVPSAAGLILAGEVARDILRLKSHKEGT